jgi:hypothetical protein
MPRDPKPMTGAEFKRAISKVGLSIRGAADFLGLSESTAFRIAAGKYEAPLAAAKLLRTMIKHGLTPDEVI